MKICLITRLAVGAAFMFVTFPAWAVMPPSHYAQRAEESKIQALAVVESIKVLERGKHNTKKKVIFRLEHPFSDNIPDTFSGICYSVDHKWQKPLEGGTIHFYPQQGILAYVTVSADGGMMTTYTPLDETAAELFVENAGKIRHSMGGAYVDTSSPPIDEQYEKSRDALDFFSLPKEAELLEKIEKQPSDLLYAELARIRAGYADEYYREWQSSRQTADLQKTIYYAASASELSPDWDRPRVLLAMVYAKFTNDLESLELATELLIEALEINPANGAAQVLLAQVLMSQGRFGAAIEQYKSLFRKSSVMITPMNTAPLALCYILDGRLQAGIIYFRELQDIHAESSAVGVGKAVLLRHAGEGERAREVLGRLAFSDSVDSEMREYFADILTTWNSEDGK